jgi:hypothetical protein
MDILTHPTENVYHQEKENKQKNRKYWWETIYTLLVIMGIFPGTLEINMEVPQNIKNRTFIRSSHSLLGIYPKEPKSAYYIDTYLPMLIVTLFTIAKLTDWSTYHQWMNE